MDSAKQQVRGGFEGDEANATIVSNNQPPWPEWSDAFLNATQWGRPLSKLGSSTPQQTRLSPLFDQIDELFEDPAGLQDLPEGIKVHNWLRPHQLEEPWKLEPDSTLQDVLALNKHLMPYKIMRLIMSSILCIEREAYHRPFPIEHQCDQFQAPSKSALWKPWHHVYSRSSAGKEKPHSMLINPYGKYIVRMFFLGKWRRILVDDRLPIGEKGELLLPVSSSQNLWLPLLSKALLRIAALSWTDFNSCVDFSVVHCLTGWIPTNFPTKGCTDQQLWCVCCQLLGSTEQVTQAPGCCLPFTCANDSVTNLPAVSSRAIFAVLGPLELRSRKNATVSISSFENVLLVSNVRYNNELPIPLWKEYRWKQWALDHGIISDMYSEPLRKIQIYNPLAVQTQPQVNDVEYWMDFDTFITFVRYFEIYYKPSYFKYSLKAWTIHDLLQQPNCAEDVLSARKNPRGRSRSIKSTKSRSKTLSPEKKEKSTTKGNTSSKGNTKTKDKKGLKGKDAKLSSDDWAAQIDQKPLFFYLLIDSMVCKQLYVCLSAYESCSPTYSHMFVGKFIWHSSSVAPLVFMISTCATKGFMLSLSPGLHVYRIWHNFLNHFCLQIYSNTSFSTGSKITIQQILTADSLSYQYYGSELSQKFDKLLDTRSGGEEHGWAYDELMEALHPPHLTIQLAWPDHHIAHKQIEQAFEESLTEMLADTTKSAEELHQVMQSVQLLFLNPKFGELVLKNSKKEFYDFIQNHRLLLEQKEIIHDLEVKEAMLDKAIKKKGNPPTKSKKGILSITSPHKSPSKSLKSPKKSAKSSIRSGKKGKRQDPKNKRPSIKRLELRKMIYCKEKNLLINEPNNSIALLKKMMSKVPHLRHLYPFGHEEDYRLFYQDYSGETEVLDNWVILIRSVLNLHSTDEVPCSLHIWSPTKRIVLRLIDNDTNKDVPFGFVENQVAFLSKNQSGFTLCVYGWSSASVEPWRLRVMGMSKGSLLHVCQGDECSPDKVAQIPKQSQQSVCGYYVPNKARLIAKCQLQVFSNVTLLLRLYLNHPTVLCRFTIRDLSGNMIHDTTGLGHIVIPILNLLGTENESTSSEGQLTGKIYIIDVKLLKESWPLSSEEIKAMLYYKEHLPDIYYKHKDEQSKASTITTKESIQSSFLEKSECEWFENIIKPRWIVTVVVDKEKEECLKLRQDISIFEALEELRQQWKQEGVDLLKCLELRQESIHQFNEEEDAGNEEDVFHLKAKRTDQMMEEYGRDAYLMSSPTSIFSSQTSDVVSSVSSSLRSSASLSTTLSASNHICHSAGESKFPADSHDSMSAEKPAELGQAGQAKMDHRGMMIERQKGIHKALADLRTKNRGKLKEKYEETLALRLQVLDSMKVAKVDEDAKKGNKSLTHLNERKRSPKRPKKPKSQKSK